MKKTIILSSLLFLYVLSFAQLKSPDDFLGYALGSHFTPHTQMVNYIKQTAENSKQVKLIDYGRTTEGRPLMVAAVSSIANISNLEAIRENNLRLTGLLNDKEGTVGNTTIVWLSYNVHGNEASSSEVAMKVLYDLVKENSPYSNYLQNVVVLIDPCLNPDGRDRYVNWYNSVVGKTPNADPASREHFEPWPSGRINHYYFDLNRDWAWQTQVESRTRVAEYQKWMPQIHADFHEQMPENPYYFAPGAEPFHNVITPWQRVAQNELGRNHARYFDAEGWLYFTKEYFDLFYPSYGDTYPLYNGSIGMTYEQAGHGMAGLAYAINQYDTLRLTDRIAHHYATSISTIEYASKNAQRLNSEFKKFFDASNSGGGNLYKTYILKGGSSNSEAVLKLLNDNQIRYGYAGNSSIKKGYSYQSQKTANFNIAVNDIIIPAAQPKGVLLQVLFDPDPKLSDSATYDITAWAVPYAYNVEGYALTEKLTFGPPAPIATTVAETNAYGYLVQNNSLNSMKFLGNLLKEGIRVRISDKTFGYKGKTYPQGTFIVLKGDNKDRMEKFSTIANQNKMEPVAVSTGFMDQGIDFGSDKVKTVFKPKVALAIGEGTNPMGAGEIWQFFEEELEYPVTLLNIDAISASSLKEFDVLILPSGSYSFINNKETNGSMKSWVRNGGKIIAIESAVSEMAAGEWGIKLKSQPAEDSALKANKVRRFEDREREGLTYHIPGAIYAVELDTSHPLAFGQKPVYYTLKTNDIILDFSKDFWNVGVLYDTHSVSGFVGSDAKNKIQNGTLIAHQPMGQGSVIYFADNPIFRSFWYGGKALLANSVFLQGR